MKIKVCELPIKAKLFNNIRIAWNIGYPVIRIGKYHVIIFKNWRNTPCF